jgi:preprotein translocase subunit SecY
MFQALINCFKIPDLRNKLLFTIGALVVYRLGYHIPLAGIDQRELIETARQAQEEGSPFAAWATYVSIFTGGSFEQSTLFGLGILPYISAAIIFQLLATTVDSLKQLQKEGPAGRQKIQEYTRYATFFLCLFQSVIYLNVFRGQEMVFAGWDSSLTYWVCGTLGLTTGTMFLVWLGEQIDKYGIGNGASLIITAGIVAQVPGALLWVYESFSWSTGDQARPMTPMKVLFLLFGFIFVVAGTVLITQGQRRIPVQQAKHTRGRRVYGGQKHYLPLRVNHGGVMPIIFASTLMMVPTMILPWLGSLWPNRAFDFLARELSGGTGFPFLYVLIYIGLIYFFAYFWTSVQFQPREMAENLRDHGSFIPGLRPGPRTAEYLEKVMERITYVGAGFLAVIAIVPTIVSTSMGIPYNVSAFLGGTGLLIMVSVALDFIQRVEANLLMRNYKGFLSGGDGPGHGPRIRGSR